MSRFFGAIGIKRDPVQTSPGVYDPVIEEVEVKGEIRNIRAAWQANQLYDTVQARHVLSIIAPEEAITEYHEVVYILWQNVKWSVVSIEYKPPRIEFGLGGVYNG